MSFFDRKLTIRARNGPKMAKNGQNQKKRKTGIFRIRFMMTYSKFQPSSIKNEGGGDRFLDNFE